MEDREVTLKIPGSLVPALRAVRRAASRLTRALRGPETALDLGGDRDLEWSWVAAHIGTGPGQAIDFGCGPMSSLGLLAAHAGYQVMAIDLGTVDWPYQHPRLTFRRGDILNLDLPAQSADLVINCSAIEHVGLAGRYDVVTDMPDGDLEAMNRFAALLRPGGRMLLTIPVGQDAVFIPLHRVYGTERLPQLLRGYQVEHREYWTKDEQNRWAPTSEDIALAQASHPRLYGLGCFVLRVAAVGAGT